MNSSDIEAIIEEIESTPDESRCYIQIYWQEGADKNGLASLIRENWSSPSKPCSQERAMKAIIEIRKHKDDAVMLSTASQRDAEQLVLQAVHLGATALLDD